MRVQPFAVSFAMLLLIAVTRCPCARSDDAPFLPDVAATGFDPAASVSVLTDAAVNENAPQAPFVGLATQLDVDRLFGAVTTSIPIELPPGLKGMIPDLTVRYSSNGGNGPFGVGWDLPLGTVKRNTLLGVPLGATPGQYDDAKGFVLAFRGGTIVLDACNNGAPANASCTSWKSSSEEIWLSAQFLRASNVWLITDKNGVTYTYGGESGGVTAGSRTGLNTSVAASTFGWSLTSIRDPNGNDIRVTYGPVEAGTPGNGGAYAYPTAIDYGGNSSANLTPVVHVSFSYDHPPRPDVVTSYQGGFAAYVRHRLDAIIIWVDGFTTQSHPTRTYQLWYAQDPDTNWSLLTNVSETVADGTQPPPTTFTYQAASHALAAAEPMAALPQNDQSGASVETAGYLGLGEVQGFIDIDGDGLPDYLDGETSMGPHGEPAVLDVYRNRGAGSFVEDTAAWTTEAAPPSIGPWSYIAGPIASLVDMNGDGLPDLLRSDSSSCSAPGANPTCRWSVFWNTNGMLNPSQSEWPGVPADLNGALALPNGPAVGAMPSSTLRDLNGDGLPDLLDCNGATESNHTCLLYANSGNGFSGPVAWSIPTANDSVTNNDASVRTPILTVEGSNLRTIKELLDINGDGLPDLVCFQPWSGAGQCRNGDGSDTGAACSNDAQCPQGRCARHWDVWFNTGSGFTSTSYPWPAPPFGGQAPLQIDDVSWALRDMNGDGLPDLIDASRTAQVPWTVYLNNGTGFGIVPIPWIGTDQIPYVRNQGWPAIRYDIGNLLDLNGDGIGDYVNAWGQTLNVQFGRGPRNNLLVRQDNGLGAWSEVTYVPSTDPTAAGTACVGGPVPGVPCMTNAECSGGTCAAAAPGASHLPFATWVAQTLTTHSGYSGTCGAGANAGRACMEDLDCPQSTCVGNVLQTSFAFTGGYFDPASRRFRGFRQAVERRTADGRQMRHEFAPPPAALNGSPAWYGLTSPRPFKQIGEEVWDGAGHLLTRSAIDWEAAGIAGGARVQIHPLQRLDLACSVGNPSACTANDPSTKTRTQDFTHGYDAYNNVVAALVSGNDVGAIPITITYGAASPCHGQPTEIVQANIVFALSIKEFTYDSHCNLRTFGARLGAYGEPPTPTDPVIATTLDYDPSVDSTAAGLGQPTRITRPSGITASAGTATTLTYGCSHGFYPCMITAGTTAQGLGLTTSKTWDLQWGQPLSLTDANSQPTTFAYNGLGQLTTITRVSDALPWRRFNYTVGTSGAPPAPSRIETLIREPNADTGFTNVGYRTVSTLYDSLGRALESKREDVVNGSRQVVATDAVTFDAAGRVASRALAFVSSLGLTSVEAAPSTAGFTRSVYDALDRIVAITNPDGTSRSADYSIAGRTLTRDENATATGSGVASGGGRLVQEFRDGLGRLVDTRVFDGNTALITRTVRTRDALNRLTAVTTYSNTTDSGIQSNTVQFTYDSFGRRTSVVDPDSGTASAGGTWTYAYDLAGNLIYQDDPKTGQHIELCYDRLNRPRCQYDFSNTDALSMYSVTATGAPAGSSCPGTPTTQCPTIQHATLTQFTYDVYATSAFTCALGVGRLCHVDDQSGTTSFSYDGRGRVLQSQKNIFEAITGTAEGFTFEVTYDVADRLRTAGYPTESGTEVMTYAYDAGGHLVNEATDRPQAYLSNAQYDRFGRATLHLYGTGLIANTWTYFDGTEGPGNQFRLKEIKVNGVNAGSTVYQQFDYTNATGSGAYDQAGNLLAVTENSAAYATGYTFADNHARDNDWTYAYDGIGRLHSATAQDAATWGGVANFNYDFLGNMTAKGGLVLTPNADVTPTALSHPHQIHTSKNGAAATSAVYKYDADGALTSRPDTDGTGTGHPDTARTMTYDVEGRVQTISAGAHTVYSLYDYTGARVARVVDNTTATLYFGRLFELTGTSLTRHIYAGYRRIAQSTVTRTTLLASTDSWAARVTALASAAGASVAILLLPLIALIPGRVRISFSKGRRAPLRWMRRGHVLALVAVVVSVPCGQAAMAITTINTANSCGCLPCPTPTPGGPPLPTPFPVYFIHGDHLGSTTMLMCLNQGASCPDGTPAEYFRYDAYGMMNTWDSSGATVAAGSELTDLLYTGQRWDAPVRTYYYGARFYDPRIASFLTQDPVREYINQYAYVGWNPMRYTDPTGATWDTTVTIGLAVAVTAGVAAFTPFGLNAVGGLFGAIAADQAVGATPYTVMAGFLVGVGAGFGGAALQAAGVGAVLSTAVAGGLGAGVSTTVSGLLSGNGVNVADVALNSAVGFTLSGVAGLAGSALVSGTDFDDLQPTITKLFGGLSSVEFKSLQNGGAEAAHAGVDGSIALGGAFGGATAGSGGLGLAGLGGVTDLDLGDLYAGMSIGTGSLGEGAPQSAAAAPAPVAPDLSALIGAGVIVTFTFSSYP